MFAKEDCSYLAYRKLLREIRESGMLCDYADVAAGKKERFLILRHDIEFSVDRAYGLSEIEKEEAVQATYFVQITNNAYNPFSVKNKKMLQKMAGGGQRAYRASLPQGRKSRA